MTKGEKMSAEKISEFRFYTHLDNHEPTRADASGSLEVWKFPGNSRETVTIPDASMFKDAERALYLLDNGLSVIPYYVAGWNSEKGTIHLKAMPTNPNGETRPDNGQVIDFGTWVLGPRRAYHLKIRPV